MKQVFEDKFSEIQTDMIDICLEYANYDVDVVYIYASFEANVISCDYFYKIDGKLVERHKLSDIDPKKYDTSGERQEMCLEILIEDMKKLNKICKEYGQDMPTEIKMVYDAKKNSVNADYKYDPQYSYSMEKSSDDIAEEWFEAEKRKA